MKSNQERVYDIVEKARKIKIRTHKMRICALVTSIVTALTAINLTLFLPLPKQPDRLDSYATSEYYSIIRTVDALASNAEEEPQYKNNLHKWTGNMGRGIKKGFQAVGRAFTNLFDGIFAKKGGAAMDNAMPENSTANSAGNGSYEEVTDNQVNGIVEGDLFKRTNQYIFHLRSGLSTAEELNAPYNESISYTGNGFTLCIYDISGNSSQVVGRYEITPETSARFYTGEAEMYLSENGNSIIIITPSYSEATLTLYTSAILLDVSTPSAVTEVTRKYVSGSYVTSRKIDNQLLLVSNFSVRFNPDYDKPEQYLPQISNGAELQSLPVKDIYVPDNAFAARYTVLSTLNFHTLAVNDAHAFLSYSDSVYVSESKIFATQPYTHKEEVSGGYSQTDKTDISCISYANDSLTYLGTATVKGTVKDQYSMDEYNNVLRVFTSHRSFTYKETERGNNVSMTISNSATSASFYAIELTNFTQVASEECFAPEGDSVQSVRFDGETAYVCTAIIITMTDPVYAFNLSDLSAITYTDTGEIKGYSFALRTFKDNTLLGLGYDEDRSFKISLYEETGTSVQETCDAYTLAPFAVTSEHYKTFFVNAERGYVGIYDTLNSEYVLVQYDGYRWVEVTSVNFLSAGNAIRACMVDGYLYVLGSYGMKPVQVF